MKTLVMTILLASGEAVPEPVEAWECWFTQGLRVGAGLAGSTLQHASGAAIVDVACRPPESFLETLLASSGPCEEDAS